MQGVHEGAAVPERGHEIVLGLEGDELARLDELVLDAHEALGGTHPRGQLRGIVGLGQVLVGAGVEAGHDVFGGRLGGEHEHERVALTLLRADGATHVDARHAGHHPVQDGRVEGLLAHQLERLCAVLGDADLMPPARHQLLQEKAQYEIVLCHQ